MDQVVSINRSNTKVNGVITNKQKFDSNFSRDNIINYTQAVVTFDKKGKICEHLKLML